MADKSLALIGNASGQDGWRSERLLRGIFDKETRRKALAVVGAAMELGARFGIGKRIGESGSSDPPRVVCEIGICGRDNFADYKQTGIG